MPDTPTHSLITLQSDSDRMIEVIVTALYRNILGREPDKAGLEHHMQRLQERGLESGFPSLLTAFMSSAEYNRAVVAKAFSLSSNAPVIASTLPIKHVISLGTHCYSSAILKRLGLKKYSTPFDWLFSSSDMVEHCIEDNFSMLLDRDQYEFVAVENRVNKDTNICDHRYYRSAFGVRFVFNHRNPATSRDFAYYVRCVDRFRRVLSSGDPALFLMVTKERANNGTSFSRLVNSLRSASRGAHLLFIEIGGPTNKPFPDVSLNDCVEESRFYSISPTSLWNPLSFADPINDTAIARLIMQYPMKLATQPPAIIDCVAASSQ